MSLNRYAKRRDQNEADIIAIAEQIGWFLTRLDTPTDWLGWLCGNWYPIEIKQPKGKYTNAQDKFIDGCLERGARVLTWRTSDDCLRDTNAARLGKL